MKKIMHPEIAIKFKRMNESTTLSMARKERSGVTINHDAPSSLQIFIQLQQNSDPFGNKSWEQNRTERNWGACNWGNQTTLSASLGSMCLLERSEERREWILESRRRARWRSGCSSLKFREMWAETASESSLASSTALATSSSILSAAAAPDADADADADDSSMPLLSLLPFPFTFTFPSLVCLFVCLFVCSASREAHPPVDSHTLTTHATTTAQQ